MTTPRTILSKYFSILEGEGTACYLFCKQVSVCFASSDSIEYLWRIHDDAMENMKVQDTAPKQSLLDLKIELAHRLFQSCCFCEHRCRVNRQQTMGKCGVKESRIASEFLHFGEELMLVPSYTVFFSGCTFHCVFCQNWDISQNPCGVSVEPEALVKAIEQRKRQGAYNVNWVGGDPTSNLLFILKVLKQLDTNIPQVWNSNMYCSEDTMKLLHGIIDVYLTDFKYGNDACAQRLSKVDKYTSVVKRNHVLAYKHGEVIIRHLVMPNHRTCCSQPVFEWIQKNTPEVVVNVMGQYRPEYHADQYKEIAEPILKEDYLQIKEYAEHLGLFLI